MIAEFSVPSCATDWLRRELGREPYQDMDADVRRWLAWYEATGKFYERTCVDWSGGEPTVRRYKAYSLRPARRVCREWASLLFSEGTRAAAQEPAANAWLQGWLASESWLALAQRCVERAFALGTGALALGFSVPSDPSAPARMRLRRYDARMVLPLSWDDAGTTECALVTEAVVGGKRLTQANAHVLDPETGTYHMRSAWFDSAGRRVEPEGMLADLDTGQALPTFSLVSPATDNLSCDLSPMGQSVFEDATDAVRGVDEAWDTLVRELGVTKPKVFLSDGLLQVRDEGGKRVVLPAAPEDTVFRAVSGMGTEDIIKTFQPDIRSAALREMLDTALAELGDLTGFGQNYFTITKQGGVKTATEVSADSSALMRNLRKHEQAVGAALSRMLTAAVSCASSVLGEAVPAPAQPVAVTWDDSIVEDTPAEKAQAQGEVAAGLLSAWEYRARFFGEDEATARQRAAEASGGAAPAPLDLAPGAGAL